LDAKYLATDIPTIPVAPVTIALFIDVMLAN
jgi:hypothetical protein